MLLRHSTPIATKQVRTIRSFAQKRIPGLVLTAFDRIFMTAFQSEIDYEREIRASFSFLALLLHEICARVCSYRTLLV
jgi:hypothetical protein